MISIVLAIVFLFFAVLFLIGKGDKLIAGYNTASEEEKKRVNIKRLRILMAILSVITAAFIGDNTQGQMGATVVFIAVTVAFIILANTWAKKK